MAIVFTAILMVVLIGFAALTIDVGALYNTRADLQDAADAAALAGASAYATDHMLRLRGESDPAYSSFKLKTETLRRAREFAARNPTLAKLTTHLKTRDVTLGWIDLNSATSPIDPGYPEDEYNAVQVITRRTAGSANGPVALWFANIFGKRQTDIVASATAAYDNRVVGVDPRRIPRLLPFTLNAAYFDENFDSGPDAYAYDEELETVRIDADGVHEIRLYPHPTAPGNFGALNIGITNQSTSEIEDQIVDGVPPEHLIAEIGTDILSFVDDFGEPESYAMTGNTGMSSAMEASLASRVGEIVGFFLHSSVEDSGSNATYQIVRVVYGRLMAADLRIGVARRGIWIQPVPYNGEGVVTSPDAPPSDGLLGKIVLAR